MRQYTFVALMIGALPSPEFFHKHIDRRDDYAQRVAAMTGLAAETFNDGLRAYYFSFATMGWFFSPLFFYGHDGIDHCYFVQPRVPFGCSQGV